MTPDERQMIAGLFDRVRDAERNPRDRDAEAYIAGRVREAPNAAYTLAQVTLVQEQALGAAQRRIEELEERLRQAESQTAAAPQQGGFLGGLGSLFGGGQPQTPAPSRYAPAAPQGGQPGPWGGQPMAAAPSSRYAPQQGGPWSAPAAQPARGGGFLSGALGAAAGVAGGMLLANSIQGLFRSDPALSHTAGADHFGGGNTDSASFLGSDLGGAPDQGLSFGDGGYQNASQDDGLSFGGDDSGGDDYGSDV
jgi:hypothetical protein